MAFQGADEPFLACVLTEMLWFQSFRDQLGRNLLMEQGSSRTFLFPCKKPITTPTLFAASMLRERFGIM